MKTLLLFSIIALFFLGACTETIEIEKLITDTIYVEKPVTKFVQTVHVDTVYKELLRVDTVEVQVVVHDVDTVIQIKTDSIFIETVVEKIVNHYDTVVQIQHDTIVNNVIKTVYVDKIIHVTDTVYQTEYEQIVTYLNTEYVYIFPGQSVTFIPEPLRDIHQSFIDEANKRGKSLPGGDLVITYVSPSELPGENWTSYSQEMAGFQWILYVSDQVTVEQSYTLIYRELARIQLGKKYTNVADRIMNPLFNPATLRTTDSDTKKKPYLDILFQ